MSDTNPSESTRTSRSSGANNDDQRKTSFWQKLRAVMTLRTANLRDDLAEALGDISNNGQDSFSDNERTILQNVLKLGGMRVDDVMVPRADIDAVDVNETMAELIKTFHEAGHSRLPVYAENLDSIVGFVHIKDALHRLTALAASTSRDTASKAAAVKLLTPVLRQKIDTKDFIRKLLYVPPSMPVGDLLQKMQATRVHMAMVVDEYGGIDGLVTIEDLLEAVVGDIEDEHDDADEALIRKIDDHSYIADARIELTELQEFIGDGFDPGEHADEADTLGGLIFDMIDRVPVRGEVITKLKGFEFEILQADPRRIKKVRISRRLRVTRPRPAAKSPAEKPVGE